MATTLTDCTGAPSLCHGNLNVRRICLVDDLREILKCSCKVPFIQGIFPHKTRYGYYIDGLYWSTFFVPWESQCKEDISVKVSVMDAYGSYISPSIPIPPW
eukprot:Mrub_07035.p5 GENE.Mrub_07035~~Mrub_07035.p5  ORF type:complete len:101 (+),score=7.79 Mrub_07035:579-881(+)